MTWSSAVERLAADPQAAELPRKFRGSLPGLSGVEKPEPLISGCAVRDARAACVFGQHTSHAPPSEHGQLADMRLGDRVSEHPSDGAPSLLALKVKDAPVDHVPSFSSGRLFPTGRGAQAALAARGSSSSSVHQTATKNGRLPTR